MANAIEQRLAHFQDVPLELTVELDRRMMKVREILGMQVGSLIRMNKSAGDNMSLVLHGVLLGFGEVVVIENTIGIRITDIRRE